MKAIRTPRRIHIAWRVAAHDYFGGEIRVDYDAFIVLLILKWIEIKRNETWRLNQMDINLVIHSNETNNRLFHVSPIPLRKKLFGPRRERAHGVLFISMLFWL